MSIQEWLIKIGFTADMPNHVFIRTDFFGMTISFPFESLIGHSLSSFKRFARNHQWITEDEAQ